MLVGYVGEHKDQPGRDLTNEVALLQNGKISPTRTKTLLPTYDVFDEDRYFEPALTNPAGRIRQRNIGLTICEDIWNDEDFWPQRRYRANPASSLLKSGAEIIFNVSASPWSLGKEKVRYEMLRSIARKSGKPGRALQSRRRQ